MVEANPIETANAAFDRMERARQRNTGCHLTAEMIQALSVTFLGEVMSDTEHRKRDPSHG